MKRARIYEIEAATSNTYPWRLVVHVMDDRTTFNLYWGDKIAPTHIFHVNATDWKEIASE